MILYFRHHHSRPRVPAARALRRIRDLDRGRRADSRGDSSGNGAFLIGAHMGSFEVTRAIGVHRPGLEVVMAMYERQCPQNQCHVGCAAAKPSSPRSSRLDRLEAMLKVRQRLDDGAFVGILGRSHARRRAAAGSELLGSRAYLPVGPMRAAALLRRRMIFMLGLYRGGNRYHAHI